MREITKRPNELSLTQQKALQGKLNMLADWTSSPRTFESARSLQELFRTSGQHFDALYSPSSIAFIRNQITESTVIGNHGSWMIPAEALSLDEHTSAVSFSQERNMLVYVPSLKGKSLFLGDMRDRIFESTLSETGIKLSQKLSGKLRSFLAIPLYFQERSQYALGSVFMGWEKEAPIDPFSDFDPACVMAEYLSIPFLELSLKEGLKRS